MHQPGNLSIDSEHHYFWHVITLPTTIHFLNQLLIKALLTKSLRKLHQNCTLLVKSSPYKMHQPGNLSIDSEHHYFWHVITLPTTIHFLNQLLIKALLTKSLRKLHQNCTLPTNKNKFKKINKRNNSFVYLKALKNLWKQIFYIVWF